jgi:hypothetical protein
MPVAKSLYDAHAKTDHLGGGISREKGSGAEASIH